MSAPMSHHHTILIIGGGITGLTSALALTRFVSPPPSITVCETRSSLPTLGGAINLTPNGLRYLNAIGALDIIRSSGAGADVRSIDLFALDSGAGLGQIDFAEPDGSGLGTPPFNALRIKCADLLGGLLEAARKHPGIKVLFGKYATQVQELSGRVTVSFADGSAESAELLLGCDGIHSAVRQHLQPDRRTIYTGIAAVNGYTNVREDAWKPRRDTEFLSTRQGRFFASFYEKSRAQLFVAGIWETEEVKSRDGWQAKGKDQLALEAELKRRFGHGAIRGVDGLIDAVNDWSLYPVYSLQPNGVWHSDNVLLLGDAAHAMSPQGESATIAMEDAIVFSRLLACQGTQPLVDVFDAYEKNRRARIEAEFKRAEMFFSTIKDPGWFAFKAQEWLTSTFLWFTSGKRRSLYVEDLSTAKLELGKLGSSGLN